ncbi:hypothetical protein GW17_00059815 [Ensete ventricosum]|nr:hypothetical protein GW17_00059815 [Ensete ventricosum]
MGAPILRIGRGRALPLLAAGSSPCERHFCPQASPLQAAIPCGCRRPPLRAGPSRSSLPPCGWPGHEWPPLQEPYPWPATLAEGLHVVGHTFSSLPSL